MKTGRNDPCPCGSGKKFKKCCITKSEPAKSSVPSVPLEPPREFADGVQAPAPSSHLTLVSPPPPHDPVREKLVAFREEFESQDWEGRRTLFLQALDDQELMDDVLANEMLHLLHEDAVDFRQRPRFAELVDAFAPRQPEMYQLKAHDYLSLRL